MTFRLDGRKALVTGASRGIGRAIAVSYAAAGADVAISARDEAKLAEVAAEIEAHGRKAVIVPADVLDGDAVRAAVDAAALALDGIDILVNNAGGNSFSTPMANMRFSGWQKTFSLNVESIVHACQAASPSPAGGEFSVRDQRVECCVTCRNAVHVSLRRCKGGGLFADQVAGNRMGSCGCSSQRLGSWMDRNRPDRLPARRRLDGDLLAQPRRCSVGEWLTKLPNLLSSSPVMPQAS